MKIEDLRAKLTALSAGLEAEAVRVNTAMAVSALSIVRNRSTDDGILVNGAKVPYSDNVIPTFFLKKSVQNQKGKDFIAQNRFSTYGDFKEVQGLKGDFINLSLSNRMWSSFAVIEAAYADGIANAKIGTVDAEVLKYVGYHFKRFGNFLLPTDIEKRLVLEDGGRELIYYFKQMLK